MRKFWLAIFLGSLLLGGFWAAPILAKEKPCVCFCAGKDGAEELTGEFTISSCDKKCDSLKQGYVTCADNAGEYPSQNPRCFKQEECTEMANKLQEKCRTDGGSGCEKIETAWNNDQPKMCMPGSHFCYLSAVADVQLGIEILGVKSVQDVTGYIDLVYRYLLSIAGILAIVMIMIGGVQYVMAAGSGKVEEAKERIKNAVIGLVLLLGAFAILYTVNPVLVNLAVPRMPMLKSVEFISGTSCEDLKPFVEKGWIEIKEPVPGKNGENYCGTVAKVVKVEESEQLTTDLPDVCWYRGCPLGEDQICVGSKDEAVCTYCEWVGPDGYKGLEPSAAVCSMLTRTDKFNLVVDRGGNINKKHYCWQTHDADLFGGLDVFVEGACAGMTIDCMQIEFCSDYDKVSVKSWSGKGKLEDIGPSTIYPETYNIKNICESDPCRWHRTDKDKDCYYQEWRTFAVAFGKATVGHDCKTKE